MKIVVCVKPVKGDINPFDESALELAFSIKNSEITVLSMGPESAAPMLRRITRLPVDRAVLLSDNAFAGSDTLATGYILSAALRELEPDLVICGKQSIDGDTAQVGVILSAMLGYQLITNALSAKYDGTDILCVCRDGEKKVPGKCVITVERSMYLRFPSIFSSEKEIEVVNADKLGVDKSRCGLRGSPTRVLKTYENERGRRQCKFISFDEMFNVIESSKKNADSSLALNSRNLSGDSGSASDKKLKEVWAVGEKVLEQAEKIAENVIRIPEISPEEIAGMARGKKPAVILWAADKWGRENAPVVQAMLNTGLCADCTALETDGEKLFMFRPAGAGNIIAKIECTVSPAMATVRCSADNYGGIVVSGGRGVCVEGGTELLKSFAEMIGADTAASRAAVDAGKFDYKMQVGLTGKNVRPEIYIACGISGAVQHTCAIEDSGIIIAINSDRDAKIFDYADYGIVDDFKNIAKTSQYIKYNGGC